MKQLFLVSFAVALSAFFDVWFFHAAPPIYLSILLTICWLVLLAIGLFKYKKRGLLLLVGAPFALGWVFEFFLIAWGCAHNIKACP
jgi:hypothetical protein